MLEEMVEVACYAGGRYPERPQRVTWRGEEHEVVSVESEWQEPRRRCYLVRLEGECFLQLYYYERPDRWTAVEVGGE